MMFQSLAAVALWAATALAIPTGLVERQSTNIDTVVLQFALTLEHLENNFYHGALQKFSEQDFIDAGYSATYYNNLKYISVDEESHVQLLSSALTAAGVTPVAPCQYKFPYTDVRSFITLSSVLEGVGTSAYLAGAPLITSKAYLTVAGSILVTEALHTSYQRGAISEVPFPNPYGTPLDPTSVYTLAANFITSCPASNAPLPFTPFPALTYNAPACNAKRDSSWGTWPTSSASSEPATKTSEAQTKTTEEAYTKTTGEAYTKTTGEAYTKSGETVTKTWTTETVTKTASAATSTSTDEGWGEWNGDDCQSSDGTTYVKVGDYSAPGPVCVAPSAGATISLTAASAIPAGSYVTFISGLAVVSVKGTISGSTVTVAIPSVAAGQTYVLITSSDNEGSLTDSSVLFGPAIVEVAPPAAVPNYTIQ